MDPIPILKLKSESKFIVRPHFLKNSPHTLYGLQMALLVAVHFSEGFEVVVEELGELARWQRDLVQVVPGQGFRAVYEHTFVVLLASFQDISAVLWVFFVQVLIIDRHFLYRLKLLQIFQTLS